MRAAEVAVIILNWNSPGDTLECLESLKAAKYPNYEVILVDNGSTDNSVACFRAQYPSLTIIENGENLGFAEGNNVGIRCAIASKARYVLLLNNDTILEPHSLTELLEVAEDDPKIGIVGPKVVYDSDPGKIESAGGRANLFFGLFLNKGHNHPSSGCAGTKTVAYVSGSALLIKTEVVEKVGLLDKDFFLYLEDIDWNFRAHLQGYRSVVNCDTTVRHKSGASRRSAPDLIYYYFARNSLLFLKKHGKWYHVLSFIPSFVAVYAVIFISSLVQGKRSRCKYIIAGVGDYLRGYHGRYR